MKTMLWSVLAGFLISFAVTASAETVVTEVGVPIAVDNGTYTVVTSPDYYYYTGHRCYLKQREDLGVNFLGLRAAVDGGSQIYCYPYP